jgi:hypothetical protein
MIHGGAIVINAVTENQADLGWDAATGVGAVVATNALLFFPTAGQQAHEDDGEHSNPDNPWPTLTILGC